MSDRDLTEAIEAAARAWAGSVKWAALSEWHKASVRMLIRPVVEAVAETLAADACPDPAAHGALVRVEALAEDAEQWAREAADAPDYGRGRVDLVCEWFAKRIRSALDPEAGSARETAQNGPPERREGSGGTGSGSDAARPSSAVVYVDGPTNIEVDPSDPVIIPARGLWRVEFPSGRLTRLPEGGGSDA